MNQTLLLICVEYIVRYGEPSFIVYYFFMEYSRRPKFNFTSLTWLRSPL